MYTDVVAVLKVKKCEEMTRQNISPLSVPSGKNGIFWKINPGVKKITMETSKSVIARWNILALYGLFSIPLFLTLTAQTRRLPIIVQKTITEKERRRKEDSSEEYTKSSRKISENSFDFVSATTVEDGEENDCNRNVRFVPLGFAMLL